MFFQDDKSLEPDVYKRQVKGLPLLIYRYEDGFVSAYYKYQESVFILAADKISDDEIIKIIEGIN